MTPTPDPALAARLLELSVKSTQDPLNEDGRYFNGDWHEDLTQCSHGDTGNYSNKRDGQFIAALWNAYRSGQLITLADHEAAVAKAVEAERAKIDALERELRATVAERTRAQKDCELIAKRFTPKPIRFAPKDRIIIGVERPPQEDQTFFYDLIWCPDRKQFVTPFVRSMNGASHYLDPINMIGIVWPREAAAIRARKGDAL